MESRMVGAAVTGASETIVSITLFAFTGKTKIGKLHETTSRYRIFMTTPKKHNILLYADSERNADILWATDFLCPDAFAYVRTTSGKRHIVMSDLEIDRAKKQSNAHHVHSLTTFMGRARERYGENAGIAEAIDCVLGDLKIKSVTVPRDFAIGLAEDLRGLGIRVTSSKGEIFPERAYKRKTEIAHIRRAMRAAEKGVQAGIDLLRAAKIGARQALFHSKKRLTCEQLRTVINTTVLAEGCAPMGTIVATGKRSCDPHDRGSGVIYANNPIIIDVFPRSEQSGYYGDITRTVVKGQPSDYVKRMYQAVFDAQRQAIKTIKAGVNTREIHQAILDLFEARGFPTGRRAGRMQGFFHGTGHGLGLEIHEPPRIALNDTRLEVGMVITVEPGLYYHPHGGVRIEDTVVVTKDGVKNLTRLPKVFAV